MVAGSSILRLWPVAFAGLVFALPAQAEDIVGVRNLQVAVNGTVGQRCAMGTIDDLDFGNLERRRLGSETRVALDCNVPFSMTIAGQSGALSHSQMPQGQGPYAGSLPYSLGVTIPVRHPASEIVTRTFAGRELQAGGVITSKGGIATDGMVLSIRLGDPGGEAGLLAGTYAETITITVAPI